MSEIDLSNARPVFVLGVGRCGSTFVQKLICENSPVWIWGEHEGLLTGLFKSFKNARDSKALNDFSYRYANKNAFEKLSDGNNITAWMLPFLPTDLDEIERKLVFDLFGRCLPSGHMRWGFKEIRYGPESGVSDHLLKLFPHSRIIHLVREPFANVNSALRAWHSNLANQKESSNGELSGELNDAFDYHVTRWTKYTKHYLELEENNPDHVKTFKIESIELELKELFDFIEEPIFDLCTVNSTEPTNHSGLSNSLLSNYSKWFQMKVEQNLDNVSIMARRLGYS